MSPVTIRPAPDAAGRPWRARGADRRRTKEVIVRTWEYARTAIRYSAFIVAATLAGAAASYYISSNGPVTYSSSLRIIIGPNANVADRSGVAESLTALDRQGVVKSLVEVLSSRDMMSRATADVGVPPTDDYTSRAAKVPDANVVQVWVEGPEAGKVTALALRTAILGIEYFEDLYKLYRAEVLEQPAAAEKIAPMPARDAVVGAALIGALAALSALAIDRLRSGGRPVLVEAGSEDRRPVKPVPVKPVPAKRAATGHLAVPADVADGDESLPRRKPTG
jgi:hypothetical protein